jgi:hypothetical protein
MAFTQRILTKLALTKLIFMGISDTEFYPDRKKNVDNIDRMLFITLGKVGISLHRFS